MGLTVQQSALSATLAMSRKPSWNTRSVDTESSSFVGNVTDLETRTGEDVPYKPGQLLQAAGRTKLDGMRMLGSLPRFLQKFREEGMLASLVLGTGVAFLIQAAGVGLTYFSHILFARWMGPVEYGAYAYVFTWAQMLALLSGLGLTTGVLRFIPQYLTDQDWGRLRGVVSRSRQLTFTTGVLLAALGTVVLLLLQPQDMNTSTLLIGMWLVPLLASLNLQRGMIRGTQRVALADAPPMLIQPILVIGVAFLVLQATSSLTSVSTMSAVTLAILLVLTAQVWALGLLAVGRLVNASTGPVGYLMNLTGYQNLSARVYGFSALLNILLNGALIPLWGLAGAVLATTTTMILWNVCLYILVKKHLGIRSFAFATAR